MQKYATLPGSYLWSIWLNEAGVIIVAELPTAERRFCKANGKPRTNIAHRLHEDRGCSPVSRLYILKMRLSMP
jgi:hypothetical protein